MKMKLKEFNIENCKPDTKASRFSTPTISINLKYGVFRFNGAAVDLIGIKDGDMVVLHQDEDEPTDWYIEKAKAKGFPVRSKKSNTTSSTIFNSVKLAREIATSVSFNGTHGRMLIAGTPTKFEKRQLWGVLTGGLKNI